MTFSKLVTRSALLNEARVSPFEKINPAFSGVTKTFRSAGLSSAPYDTIKYICRVLGNLEIFSEDEVDGVLKAGATFKAKQGALISALEKKKKIIIQRSTEVEQAVKDGMESYVRFVATNRGSARTGGRAEKYEAQKAALELQKQTKELEKQAKSPEAKQAVEVIAAGLDDASKARVNTAHETTLLQAAAAKVFKSIRDNMGEEGVDVDDFALSQVEEYVSEKITNLEQLKKFISQIAKEPGYQVIAAYLADIIKPVKDSIASANAKEAAPQPAAPATPVSAPAVAKESVGYTLQYLSEEKTNTVAKMQAIGFREKYKPKTSWQLQELRNYGL